MSSANSKKYNLRNKNKVEELRKKHKKSSSNSNDQDDTFLLNEDDDNIDIGDDSQHENETEDTETGTEDDDNDDDYETETTETEHSEEYDTNNDLTNKNLLKKIKFYEELSKTFPSKRMDKLLKQGKHLKEIIKQESVKPKKENNIRIEQQENPTENKNKKTTITEPSKKTGMSKKSSAKIIENSIETKPEKKTPKDKKKDNKKPKIEELYTSSDESDEDADDADESNDDKKQNDKKKKVNIIFTISNKKGDDDDDDDYDDDDYDDDDYDEDDDEEQDEEEEFNSDDEKTFMKENYIEFPNIEKLPNPVSNKNKKKLSLDSKKKKNDKKNNHKKNSKKSIEKDNDENENENENAYINDSNQENTDDEDINRRRKDKNATEEDNDEIVNIDEEYLELLDTKKHLIEKLQKKPNNVVLRNALKECKETIYKIMKDARYKNTKLYKKLTRREQQTKSDEMKYFKTKLSNKEQIHIMQELKEVNKCINIVKPYRVSLLQSSIPCRFKSIAIQKLNMLRMMEAGDTEYFKIKNWVDTFMRIPFSEYKGLSVKMEDGLDVCSNFLENAKKQLDDCVYGLEDAKLQIMQMIGQWISNPSAIGTAIAIKGPMGTGKSSLVKDGISKILGREFAFIPLGGAGDSSYLEGHSYTYEGSTWGKIVQILIDSKCMNPIIYFDELDKISGTPRGEEIIGILTHLTDTTQNNQFHDKYFSEIDFDLSKCLFIFSYNDDKLVNPILKDRMYCIQTKGYETKEKIIIAKNYLLPKIREQVKMNESDIQIPDETLQYIINTTRFTKGESGVRNLKRCLEIIYTKLNLFRLIKPENKLFLKQINIEVSFPMIVLKNHVDILIQNEEDQNQSLISMYV